MARDERDADGKGPERTGGEGEGMSAERRGLEHEIEEILRDKGERPVPRRQRRPSYYRRRRLLPRPSSPLLTLLFQYVVGAAIGGALLFIAFRTLGPAGLRLTVLALFLFLLFYALRGLVQDILRRRMR
jgi:hypothetical protein